VTGSFRDSTCSILCDVDRDQSKRLPMMNAGTRVPVPVKNCIDPLFYPIRLTSSTNT